MVAAASAPQQWQPGSPHKATDLLMSSNSNDRVATLKDNIHQVAHASLQLPTVYSCCLHSVVADAPTRAGDCARRRHGSGDSSRRLVRGASGGAGPGARRGRQGFERQRGAAGALHVQGVFGIPSGLLLHRWYSHCPKAALPRQVHAHMLSHGVWCDRTQVRLVPAAATARVTGATLSRRILYEAMARQLDAALLQVGERPNSSPDSPSKGL